MRRLPGSTSRREELTRRENNIMAKSSSRQTKRAFGAGHPASLAPASARPGRTFSPSAVPPYPGPFRPGAFRLGWELGAVHAKRRR
jgi:hypothetical protein